jgi:hypothetical protein
LLGCARGIADAHAEFMEGSKDVRMAAQQAGHEHAEQQDNERHDHDQSNHCDSSSGFRPSIQPRTNL